MAASAAVNFCGCCAKKERKDVIKHEEDGRQRRAVIETEKERE